jgi:hypothetical protein
LREDAWKGFVALMILRITERRGLINLINLNLMEKHVDEKADGSINIFFFSEKKKKCRHNKQRLLAAAASNGFSEEREKREPHKKNISLVALSVDRDWACCPSSILIQ